MRSHGEQQYRFLTLMLNKLKEDAQVIARTARPDVR
jgi:hypothetical protein